MYSSASSSTLHRDDANSCDNDGEDEKYPSPLPSFNAKNRMNVPASLLIADHHPKDYLQWYNEFVNAQVPSLLLHPPFRFVLSSFSQSALAPSGGHRPLTDTEMQGEMCAQCQQMAYDPVLWNRVTLCRWHVHDRCDSASAVDIPFWGFWCDQRIVKCRTCNNSVTIGRQCSNLLKHVQDDCLYLCVHGCGERLRYNTWQRHMEECSNVLVSCPLQSYLQHSILGESFRDQFLTIVQNGGGCCWHGPRAHLSGHLTQGDCLQKLTLSQFMLEQLPVLAEKNSAGRSLSGTPPV
jgi:hypothetical protein